jgi:hypothetical protein
MDTNERSQYRARESRKVYVNTKSVFLKIEFDRNYMNQYNIFNQVGLMNLDFFGVNLPPLGQNMKINKFILRNATRGDNNVPDEALENICGEELNELKTKMDANIKIENYLECKQIKLKLDKVRMYGRQIFDLENQKRIAVNNEDFDQAMEIKGFIDKMKANIKTVIKNTNANVTNITNDIENQTVGNNKYSQIGPNKYNNNDSLFNNNNNTNSNILNISNEINNNQNESIYSNSNDNLNNQLNQSGTKYLLNTNYSNNKKNKINEDNFISHDDTILPAVLKKLTNEPKNEPDELGSIEKGELEEIPESILKEFKLIADVIGELEMRKIFSKQILWKEEGLNYFIKKINYIL